MRRHRIKHHVNRPVVHLGLFTDGQILPAAGLVAIAAGWLYAGIGGLIARMVLAALVLVPVGVMVADNHLGGIALERAMAWLRWQRRVGRFAPGAVAGEGYALSLEEQELVMAERARRARADLESAFAGER